MFEAADYNGDTKPDLFDIQMSQTGSGKTEVHVLPGENFAGPRHLDVATPLGPTDTTNWAFPVTDWNADGAADAIALQKQGTATNTTEAHLLGG